MAKQVIQEQGRADKLMAREMLPALGTIVLSVVGLATGQCSWSEALWAVLGGTGITGTLVAAPKLFGRDSRERGESGK